MEEAFGVDGDTILVDFQVKVRTGGPASEADFGDDSVAFYPLIFFNVDFSEMSIERA